MAKKLRDEDLVLNIIVNGDKGKKEMGELERSIKATTSEVRKLERSQKELIKQGKQETEQYKTLKVAIDKKNEAIQLAEARMTQLRKGMKLTEMTTTDLRREYKRLKQLMDSSTPGSENHAKMKAQADAVGARLIELKGNAEKTGFSLGNMANKFNQYFTMVSAGFITFIAFFTGIKQIISLFAQFDDKISDVQKTTGLAKYEVKELNEELKKINTRTQQDDLLGLARIAGKLGIDGKKDVEEFVKATDQINVALSEDLGGDVEETINQVGKLVDIFKVKEEFGIEKGLLKVGSAINSLGAASTASESYLVEFTKRVAGTAPSAGVSIQKILGLASTLDQLGQTAEVAGTTYNAIIPAMFRDTAAFARIAGMGLEEFTNLLNTDANEAFIRTIEGLKGNNAGMAEMVQRLGDLGIDGTRSMNVIGVLANNTQLLREQQVLANSEFEKGSSITEEFNVKNNNAAATLDKAKKSLYNMTVELGERLFPVVTMSVNGFTMLVKVLFALTSFLIDNRKLIITVAAALIGYNAALIITNMLTGQSIFLKKAEIALAKLQVFWANTLNASMHLVAAAYLFARGNIAAAKVEMIAFNAITKLNPLGVLLAVLAAVTVGFIAYANNVGKAERAQRALNEVQAEANRTIGEERNNIEANQRILASENATRDEKLTAINRLRAIMPEYLKSYTDEQILAGQATGAINTYVEAIERKARVEASARKLADLDAKKDELNQKKKDGFMKAGYWERLVTGLTNPLKGGAKGYVDEILNELSNIEESQTLLRNKMESDMRKTTPIVEPTNSGSSLTNDQVEAREKYKREAKSQLEQEKIAHQDRLREVGLFGKARKDLAAEDLETLTALEKIHQDNIKNINDKANKQLSTKEKQDQKKYDKLIEDQRAYQQELVISQKSIVDQETAAHEERLKKAGLFGKQRKDLSAQELLALEAIEASHQTKLNVIDAESLKKGLDDRQKKFERELAELRIKNNLELAAVKSFSDAKKLLANDLSKEELAKINTLEKAKKALKQQYQTEEDQLTRAHLDVLVAELQKGIQNGDFEGISLSDKVFSEEELTVLSDRLGIAREELSKLLAGLNETGEDSETKEFSFQKGKSDIFGLTQDDWELMFENFQAGEVGIQGMVAAATALIGVWSSYSNFVAASENRRMQEFEQSTKKKKTALEKQLQSGKISQKSYSDQVAKLDLDLDDKKADLAFKQAKREKQIQVMSAITGTASAVVGALGMKPWTPLNFALAGIVGAAGLAQIGTILATPVPGREDGGSLMDVTRSQDGKKFKAVYDPEKRGYINKPTVITGETGREFVANDEAVSNPTIAPFLDIIDTAQKNGSISSLNMEKVLAQSASYRMGGRATGGYVSTSSSSPGKTVSTDSSEATAIEILLQKNLEATEKLTERLNEPIEARVALLGKNGFVEKTAELTQIQNNGNL